MKKLFLSFWNSSSFDKLKKVSDVIYGLSFVTFFMQLGATLVHGSGNAFVTGRLLAPASFVFLRSLSESLSVLFKIIAGYLSDRLQNRTFFLILGYGSAIFFKVCFFITTLDLNVSFLAVMFIVVHILDRLANGIRDPVKDAFISENTEDSTRSISFGVRKGIGSMGTFFGGIIAFYLIKNKITTASQTYFLAIIPVIVSSGILWKMFLSRNKDSCSNFVDKACKISMFIIFGSLMFFTNIFNYANCIPPIAYSAILSLLPIVILGDFSSIRSNIINSGVSFLLFNLLSFAINTKYFLIDNLSIYYVLFKSFELLGISVFLFYVIRKFIINYLSAESTKDKIEMLCSLVGKVFLLFYILKPMMKFNFNILNLGLEQFSAIFQGTNPILCSTMFKIILYLIFKEKKGLFNTLFYLIMYDIAYYFLGVNFFSGELSAIIYAFLSFSATTIIGQLFGVLGRNIHNQFIFIFYVCCNLGLYFVLLGLFNSYLGISSMFVSMVIMKLICRFLISRNIFRLQNKEYFLNYAIKLLPLDIITVISLYSVDSGKVIFFLIIEMMIQWKIYKDDNIADRDLESVNNNHKTIYLFNLIIYCWALYQGLSHSILVIIKNMSQIHLMGKYVFSVLILGALIGFLLMIGRILNNQKLNIPIYVFFVIYGIVGQISLAIGLTVLLNYTVVASSIYQTCSNSMDQLGYYKWLLPLGFIFPTICGPLLLGVLSSVLVLKNNNNIWHIFISSIFTLPMMISVGFYEALITLCGYLWLLNHKSEIIERLSNLHIVNIVLSKQINFKYFGKIAGIASLISCGKMNEAVYFERAVQFGYSGAYAALIFSFMFLFMTISSLTIHYMDQKGINKKSLFIIAGSLIASNLLMSGYLPIIPETISFFLSIIFYGIYSGSFEIIILTSISRSTEKKNIRGTLFGMFYFISGICSSILSFIFYGLIKYYGAGMCGLFASLAPICSLLVIKIL
jgi:MFS family permease